MKQILYTLLALMLILPAGSLIAQEYRQSPDRPGKGGNGYYQGNEPIYGNTGFGYANERRIKLALLLDTSGSMQGLIEQAKSQLWGIVNELSFSDGYYNPVSIEIALYEFGSSRLSYQSGYIRQITPFTRDLDWISEELFALYTGGSKEYCGEVILRASRELEWGGRRNVTRMIVIAGNESFAQGRVNFRDAIYEANSQGIQVHTIFCGDLRQGADLYWAEAANMGGGSYTNIDQNRYTTGPVSPWDYRYGQLNTQLNNTYIPYGRKGSEGMNRQVAQDENASKMGKGVLKDRTIAKSTENYENQGWDLIDALDAGAVRLENMADADLPAEMRGMSLASKQAFVARKKSERLKVRNEIRELAKQEKPRDIAVNAEAGGNAGKEEAPQTLGKAVVKSVKTPDLPKQVSPATNSPKTVSPVEDKPKVEAPKEIAPKPQTPAPAKPKPMIPTRQLPRPMKPQTR